MSWRSWDQKQKKMLVSCCSPWKRSVLNYVPRVPSCPTSLTCLCALPEFVPLSLRAFIFLRDFIFTWLTCTHFFTCLLCLHFLRALLVFNFLRALHALIFLCDLRAFSFLKVSYFWRALSTFTFFHKICNNLEPIPSKPE